MFSSFIGQTDFIFRNLSFLWVEYYSVMNARIGKEKVVLTCLINILFRT